MSFNRRKMDDERRLAAEKEANPARAQVLGSGDPPDAILGCTSDRLAPREWGKVISEITRGSPTKCGSRFLGSLRSKLDCTTNGNGQDRTE